MKNLDNIKLIIRELERIDQKKLDRFLQPCLTYKKDDIDNADFAKYIDPISPNSIYDKISRIREELCGSILTYRGNEITTVYAYKKRMRTVWSHRGEEDVLDEFERRLDTYDWKSGSMFHVILKVDHENFDPLEAENQISRNFNRLINDISRGKKFVEILKYQAIKEWDETAHPHLHLFLLISKSRISLRNLIKKYWTMGKPEIKHVKDEAHFKNCVTYCTQTWDRPNKKRYLDKWRQMHLPKLHWESTNIRRAYYASKKRVDWESAKRANNFNWLKKRHKKIMLRATACMIRQHVLMSQRPKHGRLKGRWGNSSRRKSYTYRERWAIDQTTVRIEDQDLKRPKWLTLETSMSHVTRLPGYYNREMAYVIRIPTKDLPKLFELDKLARIQEAMRSDLKQSYVKRIDKTEHE